MNARQRSQVAAFVTHAVTVNTMRNEMVDTWLSLMTQDKKCPIVEDHMSHTKAQCVQLYARKLMTLITSLDGFDMFPITQENIKVGNWRVDSIIIQIASNPVTDHDHLFQLLMTNIFGVPTVMFEFAKKFDKQHLQTYVDTTYPLSKFDVGTGEIDPVVYVQELEEAV